MEREFAIGDRLQWTAPSKDLGVANRDLGTVQLIDPDGKVTVRMDGAKDKSVAFDPREMRHFDHGYAVTSHSSQGLTAERVLVNMDTQVHPELIGSRFAYVSISRASHDAQIYTNNRTSLAESLSQDVSKTSAIGFSEAPNPASKIDLEQTRDPKRNGLASLGLAI
jgi:ATP-dependent exoDNAse (exonuclease V) alpha subunit